MFRKYLFSGLMLVLGTVLVYLILQSRDREQRVVRRQPVEVVREAEPTATRAIAPRDLLAAECRIIRAAKPAPVLEVQLRNAGESVYANVMLRFSHLGRSNRVLGSSKYLFSGTLKPGEVRELKDVAVESLPRGTTGCEARVLYADIVK